jgi:hypothetical protein
VRRSDGQLQRRAVQCHSPISTIWPVMAVVAAVVVTMMIDDDRGRAKRVAEAMLKMIKLDIAELKKAYEGRAR